MPERSQPTNQDRAAPFWSGGETGVLQIQRCEACARFCHPPQPRCPSCHSQQMMFAPVSGKGAVWAWTVNRYQWSEAIEPPYVVAEVELDEQVGLLLLTRLIDIEPETVETGMRVQVQFEPVEGGWVPVFGP